MQTTVCHTHRRRTEPHGLYKRYEIKSELLSATSMINRRDIEKALSGLIGAIEVNANIYKLN